MTDTFPSLQTPRLWKLTDRRNSQSDPYLRQAVTLETLLSEYAEEQIRDDHEDAANANHAKEAKE